MEELQLMAKKLQDEHNVKVNTLSETVRSNKAKRRERKEKKYKYKRIAVKLNNQNSYKKRYNISYMTLKSLGY